MMECIPAMRLARPVAFSVAAASVALMTACGGAPERPARPEADAALVEHIEALCRGLVADLSDVIDETLALDPLYAPSLAVLPFVERGERARAHELGAVVADLVQSCVVRGRRLRVVERRRQEEVLDEIFDREIFGEAESAALIGQRLSADLLVLGSVADAGPSVVVTAGVTRVADQQQLAARSAEVPLDPLRRLAERFVPRTVTGAMARSVLLPGWGQLYDDRPLIGGVMAGLVVTTGASALVLHALGLQAEREYTDPGRRSDASVVGRRADAERHYGWRNVALWGMGAVWLWAVVDAGLGMDGPARPSLSPSVMVGPVGATLGWRW